MLRLFIIEHPAVETANKKAENPPPRVLVIHRQSPEGDFVYLQARIHSPGNQTHNE